MNAGSIDYSPTAQARDIVLILDEKELEDVALHRMERFIRVWCTERAFFAPNLRTTKVILRPHKQRNEGIHRFIDCYRTMCQFTYSDKHFEVVLETANGPVVIS